MEPSGGQPTVEGRSHEGGKITWVEHVAGDRNNRLTRNELFSGQVRGCVVTDKIKDALPLWIGDGEAPRQAQEGW